MRHHPDSIQSHAQYADSYDDKAREYGWCGHELLFGMSFEHLSPDSRLLDIGIGTGLSSVLFAKAGLEVYGIDGSPEMLKICEAKHIAKQLKQHDINDLPLPYSESFFQYIVSCGVFHFFGDLEPIFRDVSRIIKPGGAFLFTVKAQHYDETDAPNASNRYRSEISPEGVEIFTHDKRYIKKLLQLCRFEESKEQLLLVKDNSLYSAHVVKKKL